ncbi:MULTISPECIES: DUF4145 domain-containing protein [Novosphingobium]|uniref:DUF4145 domain-containing protein n=1 Tax=Novosphingobium TaxID=165696 RepID=UPI0022F28ACB|nr:DUF4145 domain-containing protein [Novosphingobium resinovorum]GLK43994.1 hypothetical protein GCM10017612_19140 [Novosphingobium resinovorum]
MTDRTSETAQTPSAPEKAHCPTCNRTQNCDMHGQVYKPWDYSDRQGNSSCGGTTHTLLECRGCNTVFYEKDSWDDNDYDQWYDREGKEQSEAIHTKETYPKPPSRPQPDWVEKLWRVDNTLAHLMDEIHKGYESQCFILTAIGIRTAIDRSTEIVDIDTGKRFEQKLKELLAGGWIGDTEHDLLDTLTNAGNAAAHRGWSPSCSEMDSMLDVLENFIQRTFINGKRALALREGIPAKPPRKK